MPCRVGDVIVDTSKISSIRIRRSVAGIVAVLRLIDPRSGSDGLITLEIGGVTEDDLDDLRKAMCPA